MESFDELEVKKEISTAIRDLGFRVPTPIQAEALPILLDKPIDFIGMAATGTGKTAAFGIPMLEQIELKNKTTQFLVLCPTRELALQISEQISLLGKQLGVKALPVYGGSEYNTQNTGLRNGAPIVVGTPGRVIDHINRGNLKLQKVKAIILDEADEMISMGFKEELEKVLKSVDRKNANIWLFTATMNSAVRKVADVYLVNPKKVQVNRDEMLSSSVEQIYYSMKESDKAEILCKLIEAADDFYGLVFCQTKSLVMDLSTFLTSRGYKVDSLHGEKDQRAREKTMQAFRDKKVQLLICTDVASRGLDVKDVTHVINFSIPRELDNYVHRIGRTARGGKKGIAMSLVTPSHRHLIRKIENLTRSKMIEGIIPSRKEIGEKKVSKLLIGFQSQKAHTRASSLLGEDWKTAIKEMPTNEIIGRFLSMIAPDVFSDREKAKVILGPNAGLPPERGGGRGRERGRGGPRGRDGGRDRKFAGGKNRGGRPPRNRVKRKDSQKETYL